MKRARPARFADGVPEWFGKSLFEGDLERLLPHVEAAQRRVPPLANCGIKDIVNGPIAYTPDGSPLIGPAWGARNLWLNEGHSFGITAAGGSGWQLAEWITEGEPGIDMMAVDPRRFGPYTSKRYVVQKNEETYRNVFVIHFPGRGARPTRVPPRPARCTTSSRAWARCSASAMAGSAPTGSRRPGRRAQGPMELPPLELLRARRATKCAAPARARRRHRSDAVHQARGVGPGRGSLARWTGRQQGAGQDRPHGAVATPSPAAAAFARSSPSPSSPSSISTW